MLIFDGKQTEFESEIHKIIWAMGRRIVPFNISAAEIIDTDMLEGLKQVYDFTTELFSDMYANSARYNLTTKNVGFLHDYFFRLLKRKKAKLVDYELTLKVDDGSFEELKMLDLYEHMGIHYEINDGAATIKSRKYPLFLKYFSMCVAASQKRPQSNLAYVTYCDFRIFNKRFSLKIDDFARGLPDREQTLLWELHNYLISSGAKLEPRSNYDTIKYSYKKRHIVQVGTWLSKPLSIRVVIENILNGNIESLPNNDELPAYISDNMIICNYCCTSSRDKSCGKGRLVNFLDKQRLSCGGELRIPGKQNSVAEYDIKMLKQILLFIV